MTTEATLRGRSILITRAAERCATLAARLRALGARVECRPSIKLVAPEDDEPARAAVGRLPVYDWIVFTSRQGVSHFFAELVRQGSSVSGVRIAAVGQATAAALDSAGLPVALVPGGSDSVALGEALVARLEGAERLLLVRPERGDERLSALLRELGCTVDSVAFYRNVPAPGVESLAGDLAAGKFDIAIVSSPSSLERLLETAVLGDALRGVSLIALGRTTARAIRERGLTVAAVAEAPSDDALVRAVKNVL